MKIIYNADSSGTLLTQIEEGYEFDAVVLDDSRLESSRQMSVKDRLERMIYLADEREVKAKYVRGNKII